MTRLWNPENSKAIVRIVGLSLLSALWLKNQGSEEGIVLLLFLGNMALVRWRFPIPEWIILIDIIICLSIIPLWPNGIYALAIPIFEAMLVEGYWKSVAIILFIIIYPYSSLGLITVLLQAGLLGRVIGYWSREVRLYRQEADQQRYYRYQLEELNRELLEANIQGVHMAEVTERNRIALELHDSVGHEITAAVLAFQAFEQLWSEGDPLAKDIFHQGRARLSQSAIQLREAVYNMRPIGGTGIDGFEEVINGFTYCPIDFNIYGDTST
ncbi:MAG: histidine kinase dimerization/phosphoacceptor domain-containing protein, partial [Halanaerobiales bacterium]|nr:histidine kinase dimerization/phosphoacceptor domain-containing protein [Halanaerobiales bacterium]